MSTFSFSDPFKAQRPTGFVNTIFLIAIMALYPFAGSLLLSLAGGSGKEAVSFSHIERSMLLSIRLIQVTGQILLLALPVLAISAWHTGRKNLFSSQSLAFLGISGRVDPVPALFAAFGIFLLQPLLYSITIFQDSWVWPALGTAGLEVVRQRDLMESFIKELAKAGSVLEFLLVTVVFAVTPAVCEELFFRGYIQQNYTRSMSTRSAVMLTGFIFALFHLSAANLLPLALLGWYIGYIYAATGNLAVPVAAHFANNLAALLLLYVMEGWRHEAVADPGLLLRSPWWWLVVAGSLLLFAGVLRWFYAASSRSAGV